MESITGTSFIKLGMPLTEETLVILENPYYHTTEPSPGKRIYRQSSSSDLPEDTIDVTCSNTYDILFGTYYTASFAK